MMVFHTCAAYSPSFTRKGTWVSRLLLVTVSITSWSRDLSATFTPDRRHLNRCSISTCFCSLAQTWQQCDFRGSQFCYEVFKLCKTLNKYISILQICHRKILKPVQKSASAIPALSIYSHPYEDTFSFILHFPLLNFPLQVPWKLNLIKEIHIICSVYTYASDTQMPEKSL